MSKNNSKVVVPVSGGMDSTVLLHMAASMFDEVYAITFDYQQRHKLETAYAFVQAKIVSSKYKKDIFPKKIDVGFIRDIAPTSSLTNDSIDTPDVRKIRGEAQPKSYVPNRNMLFLSIATAYAEAVDANVVWHGAAQADSLAGYWDGDTTFVDAMNAVNRLNRERCIEIQAPLIEMSKEAIVKKGVELGVDFSLTYTCYSGDKLPDAYSASSSLRLQGFIKAGYRDPIKYKQQEDLEKIYVQNNCVEIIL